MNDWTQDVLGRLSEVNEASQALELIHVAARHLGFESCAYGLRVLFPFTRFEARMLSTYDAQWNRRYLEQGYLGIDPTAIHGSRSRAPIIWCDDVFRDTPQMWDEARSFGLRVGWAQSVFDADGRVGMLSLARSSEPLTAAELRTKDPLLQWLASTAHRVLSPRLGESPWLELAPLTSREVEVMRWTADGKTSEEIAIILDISERTVNFHVRNVMAKLHANNKSSAVALSSRLGVLS